MVTNQVPHRIANLCICLEEEPTLSSEESGALEHTKGVRLAVPTDNLRGPSYKPSISVRKVCSVMLNYLAFQDFHAIFTPSKDKSLGQIATEKNASSETIHTRSCRSLSSMEKTFKSASSATVKLGLLIQRMFDYFTKVNKVGNIRLLFNVIASTKKWLRKMKKVQRWEIF